MGTRIARVWQCDNCGTEKIDEHEHLMDRAAVPPIPDGWLALMDSNPASESMAFCQGTCLSTWLTSMRTP